MTKAAKILIFVNAAVSVMLAAWALGVYTQHVDFSNRAGTADKAPGVIAVLTARISEVNKDRATSEVAAEQSLAAVRQREDQRWANQKWYGEQLNLLEVGQTPVKAVQRGPLAQDPLIRPTLEDAKGPGGQPVKPRAFYYDDLAATRKATEDKMKKIARLVEEEKQLTETIDGPKGLRVQIFHEADNQMRVAEEEKDLQPVLVNTAAEAERLKKRQDSLNKRVDELKKGKEEKKTLTAR
jgi:hypothetical protein